MRLSLVFATCLSLAIVAQSSPMYHDKRRFGQEHTPEADATFQEVKDIAQGTDKEAQAGNLSGAMVRALLAKAPACDQQDRADEVIDLGDQLGGSKRDQLVKVAQTYRQLERNTPNAGQPSDLCNKAPRHKELDGLTQAQDPTGAKDPNAKDPNAKDPNAKDPNAKDPNAKDPNAKDPNAKDPKAKDPKAKDPNAKDPMCKDPNAKDPKAKDPNAKDPNAKDPKAKDPNAKDPKAKDPNAKDPNAKDPKTPADNGSQNVAETNPVGGVKMPKIEKKNGDFIVNGNGFNGNLDAAHARQCDVQKNLCFNKFNGGDKSFTGQDCENQVTDCKNGPPVFA